MEELERIEKYLNDHDVYPLYVDYEGSDEEMIWVKIDNGDWKHEHLYCTYLMKELGYEECGEDITEEDGSDCYSALHTYRMVKLKEGGQTNGRETTEDNRVR
jgi:hypothetical protein